MDKTNIRQRRSSSIGLVIKLIAISALICACVQTPVFAWDADAWNWNRGALDDNFKHPQGTHQWVASVGFEILEREQRAAFRWFQDNGDISRIVKYTDRPDAITLAGLTGETEANNRDWHFYIVGNNDSISDTAVGRFMFWYNIAVRQFKHGDKTLAYNSLGTALHYISDLSCPVHVAGEQVSTGRYVASYIPFVSDSLHQQYEKDAAEFRGTVAATALRGGQYTWAMSNSLRNIAIQAAKVSAEFHDVISAYAFNEGLASNHYVNAIIEPLKNTQINIAQVLYRFYIDVTGIENQTYVTVSGRNTPVWSEAKSTGSSERVATLAPGTIVTIAFTLRNDAGSLWGKVADKDCFIYMENLTTYRPPVLTRLSSDNQSYVTTQRNVVVYTEPSSYSAIARTIRHENSAVTIVSTTTNAAGNLWGSIQGGGYVFMGNVRALSSGNDSSSSEIMVDGIISFAYSQLIYLESAPTTWRISEGNLPNGINLPSGRSTTGGIPTLHFQGTPTIAGTFNFTLRIEHSTGFVERKFTLTILTLEQGISSFEQRVFELTNIEREKHGLAPLIWHDDLAYAARLHSEDLAETRPGPGASHIGSDGSDPITRIERILNGERCIDFTDGSENVAFNPLNPEAAVDGWMRSPGHRANILNAEWTHIGVGFGLREVPFEEAFPGLDPRNAPFFPAVFESWYTQKFVSLQ
jgi:uncharacterized protein YkwD